MIHVAELWRGIAKAQFSLGFAQPSKLNMRVRFPSPAP